MAMLYKQNFLFKIPCHADPGNCLALAVVKLGCMKVLGRLAVALASLSSAAALQSSSIGGTCVAVNSEQSRYCSRSSHMMGDEREKRKQEAVWGMLAGDAVAMPAHWYYSPSDIKRGYAGWLTEYRAPEKEHPGSFLTISSTDGSGRVGWHSKSKVVIGDIILHDKLKFWTSGERSTHYHQGMKAGDSTLNAVTALQTFKVLQSEDPQGTQPAETMRAKVIENYVKFMTTPGTHNDTYAESFHRLFFRDWTMLENPPKDGASLLKFCEERYERAKREGTDSQIPQIGALPLAVPWVLHYSHLSAEECAVNTVEAIKLTHPGPSLMPYVDKYARALHAVVNGQDLRQVALDALGSSTLGGARKKDSVLKIIQEAESLDINSEQRLKLNQKTISRLGLACYIDGAVPSMFFLAAQYHNDFENGILTNANCGGENAHRGAALGALLGVSSVNHRKSIDSKWKDGLNSAKSNIKNLVTSRI